MRLVKWHYIAAIYGTVFFPQQSPAWGLACLLGLGAKRWTLLPTLFLLHWQTGFYLAQVSVPQLAEKTNSVCGWIVSDPVVGQRRSQFIFKTEKVGHRTVHCLIRLSDYNNRHHYRRGQRLAGQAKLKAFRNFANPGSRPYTEQQYAQGIYMRGYIKRLDWQQMTHSGMLTRWRQALSKQIDANFKDPTIAHFVARLLLGERATLGEMQTIFQRTGTSHLIAISGLHVGIVSALCFLLGRWLWQCYPVLPLYCPSQQIASLFALMGLWTYGWLAGMAVSTQRACVMTSLWISGYLLRWYVPRWQRFLWAMALACWLNPWVVYQLGFYLSFFVVLLLLWFYRPGRFALVNMQCKLWLLLLPINLGCFGVLSFASLPANLFAIPLISFLILPLSFIWLLSVNALPALALTISQGLSLIISLLFNVLTFFGQQSLAHISWPSVPLISTVVTTFLIFYGLSLNQQRDRIVLIGGALLLLCLPFFYPRLPKGQALVRVLDVGQGLAVLITTRHHVLLYDCGSGGGSQLDMGRLVILPFLRTQRISHLDKVIISHQDSDHRGGFASIQRSLPIDELISNRAGSEDCHRHAAWQWDGIDFRMLGKPIAGSENQRSCVLQISNGQQKALLPGDIDARVERNLLADYGGRLTADLLLVPHHGSTTSSSELFVKTVKSHYAIISAGYHNRYRLPKPTVVARYLAAGSQVFNTAECGMASWLLTRNKTISPLHCYRKPGGWG